MTGLDKVHGPCPLSPWKLSTESMDSVDIVHWLSGQLPWTQWTLSIQFLSFFSTLYIGQCIVKECICSVYNACHFYYMTCSACRYMSINTDGHSVLKTSA